MNFHKFTKDFQNNKILTKFRIMWCVIWRNCASVYLVIEVVAFLAHFPQDLHFDFVDAA